MLIIEFNLNDIEKFVLHVCLYFVVEPFAGLNRHAAWFEQCPDQDVKKISWWIRF